MTRYVGALRRFHSQLERSVRLEHMATIFYVEGPCPICDAGVLSIRKCVNSPRLVVACDECDGLLVDPKKITEESLVESGPDFLVPPLGVHLVPGLDVWASKTGIERQGWSAFVAGQFDADY